MALPNPSTHTKPVEHQQADSNAEIEEVIARSRTLLELGESDECAPVSPEAWKRASAFLRAQAAVCRRLFQVPLPIPDINPADAGSVDLFWHLEPHQLLVNFPAELFEPVTYYGQTVAGDQTVAGRTTAQDERPDLVAWLIQNKT